MLPEPVVIPATDMESLMQSRPGIEPITSAEELLARFEDGKLDSLVQDCVDRLSSRQREAFMLSRDGLSLAQIGDRMAISKDSARTHLDRARKALQSEISVHEVYVERHLKDAAADHNVTRPADTSYVNDCRKIQKLMNLGTANARWRVARILCDLRAAGAPMDKVAQVTYLSPLTINALADEFANG